MLAGDLPEAGAAEEAVGDGQEELGLLEPIGGAERLLGEVTPTVAALETLDALGARRAAEEAGLHPAPGSRWAGVEWAGWVGTERGRRGGRRGGHAQRPLHALSRLQSPEHNSTFVDPPLSDPVEHRHGPS